MSFLAFLVSGAWIPGSRTSWIPDCTKQKISRVPAGIWIPFLGEKKKESFLLPTTDVPAIVRRNQ